MIHFHTLQSWPIWSKVFCKLSRFGTFEIGIELSAANDNMYASVSSVRSTTGIIHCFFGSIKDLHVEIL